jgi:hypothetical protein
MPVIDKTLPLKVQSPNVQEHWSKRYKRNEFNHRLIKLYFFTGATTPQLPCRIKLERQGNRLYDQDNYVFACKGIKDSLASLILGKKRGQDDDNPQITWEYKQVKGKPAMRIEISWVDLAVKDSDC